MASSNFVGSTYRILMRPDKGPSALALGGWCLVRTESSPAQRKSLFLERRTSNISWSLERRARITG
eukprot:7365280-Heterocapsa_arctica.AAC.1